MSPAMSFDLEVDRVMLPVACLLAVVGFVLRLAAHREQAGTWAIAFLRRRGGSPLEALLGGAWAVLMLAVPAWVALYAWSGPVALGVIPLGAGAHIAGWILLGAGAGVIGLAQAQMGASWRVGIDDARTGLVTEGLFGLVRNPIYTGMVAALAGLVLVAPTVIGAVTCVATALGVALQARIEEEHLLEQHGDAYRAYARSVGRFVPGLGRLSRPAPR